MTDLLSSPDRASTDPTAAARALAALLGSIHRDARREARSLPRPEEYAAAARGFWDAMRACADAEAGRDERELAGVRARVRDAIGLARSPAILAAWQTSATFALVTLGWVFFRAGSLADAWYVLSHLGTGVPAQLTALAAHDAAAVREIVFLGVEPTRVVIAATAVAALLAVERWQGASTTPLRARLAALHTPFRWAAYAGAVLTIMTLGVFHNARFIYFQF